MELKALQQKTLTLIKKYKYALIILAVGLLLMMWPTGNADKVESAENTVLITKEEDTVCEDLEAILTQIEGAGEVQVLLTVKEGPKTLYQNDTSISVSDDAQDRQITTVTVSDAQHNQTGLVCQVNPPTYLGAIVLCQGADSPVVQLEIIEAVSNVTGLGADSISVLKMK